MENNMNDSMENSIENPTPNEKINQLIAFWKGLDKKIQRIVYIIAGILILCMILTGISGSGAKVKSNTAKDALEIFIEHNGKDFLENVPKGCKEAAAEHYSMSEDELEETISTFAYTLYGKSYTWDFSIEDRQYDVTVKNISLQDGGKITLKELQKWNENKASSTENDLDSWAAKDQTLRKITSIAEVWDGIESVNDICMVGYTYDLDYIENKTGSEGCDEDQSLALTFVKYKGDWYCLEIIDLMVNGLEMNTNNDIARASWNTYFGSSQYYN